MIKKKTVHNKKRVVAYDVGKNMGVAEWCIGTKSIRTYSFVYSDKDFIHNLELMYETRKQFKHRNTEIILIDPMFHPRMNVKTIRALCSYNTLIHLQNIGDKNNEIIRKKYTEGLIIINLRKDVDKIINQHLNPDEIRDYDIKLFKVEKKEKIKMLMKTFIMNKMKDWNISGNFMENDNEMDALMFVIYHIKNCYEGTIKK